VALRKFWDLRWLTPEGYEWLSRALAVPGAADPRLEARAMLALSAYAVPGALTITQADATAERAADMFRACGDRAGEAEALLARGSLVAFWEREDEARALVARARALIGDDVRLRLMAMHLEVLSADRFDEAQAVARVAVAEMHRTGTDLVHEGAILAHCGRVALFQLRHAVALPWLDEAVAVARAADDEPRVALARGDQGCAALGTGDVALAAAAFTEELEICRALGYFELVPEGALGLAAVALDGGDRDRAALLCGAALDAFARSGREPVAPLRWIVDVLLEPTRRAEPGRWDREAASGAALSEPEMIDAAHARPRAAVQPCAAERVTQGAGR